MRPLTPSTQHPWAVHPAGKPELTGAVLTGADEARVVGVVGFDEAGGEEVTAPRTYTERRLLPPQISFEFPAQAKLQSAAAAETDPAPKVFPQ